MELKEGQRLRVKEFDTRPNHWNCVGKMDEWMGKIVTLESFENDNKNITICEDKDKFWWRVSDFQIVFDTWRDVKKAMKEECYKYTGCRNCPLYKSCCYDENYKQLTENFKKMFGMECYVLEDEKDKYDFTKSCVQDGMTIEFKNGERRIKIGSFFKGKNNCGNWDIFSNNLISTCNGFKIVKVYDDRERRCSIEEMIDNPINLIYERKEELVTKDVSLEEINALLKEKYPNVEKFNLPIDNDK